MTEPQEIRIQTPTGVATFPAGTEQAVIERALAEQFPASAASHEATDTGPMSEAEKIKHQLRMDGLSARTTDWLIDGLMGGGAVTATPAAVGKAVQFAPQISSALKSGAERLYGGLLKAKDATIERFPNVVRDLVSAGAPISHGGRRRVIEGLRKIGDEKQTLLTAADQRAMVPRATLREGLDDVLDSAIQNSDTPVKDLSKLAKIERELIPDERGILPSRTDRLKSKLQGEIDRTYRQMKMGTRVTDTGARAKAGVAQRAKEAVEAIEPQMRDVNARYGAGKGQAEALRDALKRTDKHPVVGLNDILGGILGAATVGPVGVPVGVAAMRALSHPRVGSGVAISLDRLSRLPHLDQLNKAALMELLSERSSPQ